MRDRLLTQTSLQAVLPITLALEAGVGIVLLGVGLGMTRLLMEASGVNAGLAEDPVTGSRNAALAQWLIGAGRAPTRYVASQGTALGRAGRVHVEQAGSDVWIGGHSVTCIDGSLAL